MIKKPKYIVYWYEDFRTNDFVTDEGLLYKEEIFDKYTEAVKRHTEIKKKSKQPLENGGVIKNLSMSKMTYMFDKNGVLFGAERFDYHKKNEAGFCLFGY